MPRRSDWVWMQASIVVLRTLASGTTLPSPEPDSVSPGSSGLWIIGNRKQVPLDTGLMPPKIPGVWGQRPQVRFSGMNR